MLWRLVSSSNLEMLNLKKIFMQAYLQKFLSWAVHGESIGGIYKKPYKA